MTRPPPLMCKVEDWLRRHDVDLDNVVVAVSGGPDSVCLLHALMMLHKTKSVRSLCVAHFNHRLRGPKSDADEDFVRHLHQELTMQLPELRLRIGQADVAGRAEADRANMEGMARQLRYAWLAEVARAVKARWIATGHTADDQAETVMHRLMRGSGIQGLRGIAPRRALEPGLTVVRPLLNLTRPEVITYLNDMDQPFRLDASNLDTRLTRNRIRHDLLPLLAEQYNPAIASVLCRLAEQADEVHNETVQRAAVLMAKAELPRAGAVLVFDFICLRDASRTQVREMLRRVWDREHWPMSAMDFAAWERAAEVVHGQLPSVDFPGGIQMRRRDRVVQLERRQ